MAKFVHDDVMDNGLSVFATADKLIICEGQPTTYTQATTLKSGGGKRLAQQTIDSGDFTGPADGDSSGRKITVNQQTGITIEESGTADHVALVDDGASKLIAVTTMTSQAVTAANTATVNAWKDEIADAV